MPTVAIVPVFFGGWRSPAILRGHCRSRDYLSMIARPPRFMIPTLCASPGRDWVFKFHHRWWRPRLHHLVLESDKSGVRTGSGREEFGGERRKASVSEDRKMTGAVEASAAAAVGGGGGAVGDLEVRPLSAVTSYCCTSNLESANVEDLRYATLTDNMPPIRTLGSTTSGGYIYGRIGVATSECP